MGAVRIKMYPKCEYQIKIKKKTFWELLILWFLKIYYFLLCYNENNSVSMFDLLKRGEF